MAAEDSSTAVLEILGRLHVLCPRCGYDLHALAAPTCPECGVTLTHELLKRANRRRSGNVLVAGVVLSILAGAASALLGWSVRGVAFGLVAGFLMAMLPVSVAYSCVLVHAWDHPFGTIGKKFNNTTLLWAAWVPFVVIPLMLAALAMLV